jgi:hypothetical protein
MTGPHRSLIAAGVVALAVLLWVTCIASRGLLSGDSGSKLADADALWKSGYASRALPYDHELDPKGQFIAYGDLTNSNIPGGRQGIYSVFFAALSAPLLVASPPLGMMFLPVLGTMLTILGMAMVGRRLGMGALALSFSMGIGVLGTPVLLYSGQYTEHTMAAGLVTLGIAMLLSPTPRRWRRDVLAGLLFGLAPAFRPEAYCVLPLAIVASTGPSDSVRTALLRAGRLSVGMLLVLVPWWATNLWYSNTLDPLLFHNRFRSSSWANANAMLWGDGAGWSRALEFGILALAILVALVPLKHRARLAGEFVVCTTVALLGWHMFRDSERTVAGLMTVTPVVAYGILRGPHSTGRELWSIAVGFLLMVLALDKSGTGGGLQHGARLLLPILPALLLLAAQLVEHRWQATKTWTSRAAVVACVVPLLMLGTAADAVGTMRAQKIAERGKSVVDAVLTRDRGVRTIIVRDPWHSQLLAPLLFHGKRLIYMYAFDIRLLDSLAKRGETSIVLTGEGRQTIRLPSGAVMAESERHEGWILMRWLRIKGDE